jgi:hypothetical protein
MKFFNQFRILLVFSAVAGGAAAQSNGDLILGFTASSGTGAATDIEVDLGAASNYAAALTPGTYNLTNLNTDLSSTYGSWATDSNLSFAIFGSEAFGSGNSSGPSKSIWASYSPYARGTSGYATGPAAGNSSANSNIVGIYSGFTNGTSLSDVTGTTASLGSSTVILNGISIGTSTQGSMTNLGSGTNFSMPSTVTNLFSTAPTGSEEVFYLKGNLANGSTSADIQGGNGQTSYFTVNSSGALTFTVDAAAGQSGGSSTGPKLINISTRSLVGTGADVQIAGFVITGTEPKTVLIRASGPALSTFGVSGVLPDPSLDLFSGQTSIASNTAWGTAANASAIESAAAQVGAFSWTSGSNDSAILTTLSPGSYTAQVSGSSGDSGVALVEVYDCDALTADSRLINISTRSDVGTGANLQIAGFVITGSQAKTVLIRASGPALSTFGVTGVLKDPAITLLSGQTVMASNTGWGNSPDAAAIATTAAEVGAFSWTSSSDDSALLVTLQPGAYTAQVSGSSGDSGVALVEVYDADSL